MTDPPLVGAWRLGNWKKRMDRGKGEIGLLLFDSILPWTAPNPPPPWWPPGVPVPPAPFEGYERNLQQNGSWKKNLPLPASGERGFNIVLLASHGLKRSQFAPPRGGERAGQKRGKDDLTQAPWTITGGFQLFLQWYVDHFLAPDTDVILVLPERDVRYFLEPSSAVGGGSPLDARDNLRAIIFEALALLGDRLVGIYLIDEPELFGRESYLTIKKVESLRLEVRKAEREWRQTAGNDPGFLALDEAARERGLLPTIVTFSGKVFKIRESMRAQQALDHEPLISFYAVRGMADLFMYDEYPYRRKPGQETPPNDLVTELMQGTGKSQAEVQQIINNSVTTTLLEDPEKTLNQFTLMRRELNEIPPPPGQGLIGFASADYRHSMSWLQASGAPFTWSATDPNWTREPSPLEEFVQSRKVDEFTTVLEVDFFRARRMPTVDETRFFTWMNLFQRSEGMPVFAQFGAANQILEERYWPVAQEVDYFSDLRMFLDINGWAEAFTATFNPPLPIINPPLLSSGVILVEYLNAPPGSVQELWMFAFNQQPISVTAALTFTTRVTFYAPLDPPPPPRSHHWERFKFNAPDQDALIVPASTGETELLLPPHSIQLFKLIPESS